MLACLRPRVRLAILLGLAFPVNLLASNGMEPARRELDRLVRDGDTPGVQYLFLSSDAVLFSHAAGSADLLRGVPVNPHTTFNIYSVTKTLTAATVLKLAKQGRIDLDRPVAHYLPDLPYSEKPTVRQALAHTAGFPNPNPMAWSHPADEHDRFDETNFVRQVLDENRTLVAPPGERLVYSNIGYLLLGRVIERVTGQPFTKVVDQQLVRPLHLGPEEVLTFTIPDPARHARGSLRFWSLLNLALGWFVDRDRLVEARAGSWLQFRNLYVNGPAYGGMIANAPGLARYLQVLLKPEGYLSPETRTLLFAPVHTRDGTELPRSLGWYIGQLDGQTFYTHSGGAAGYYCEVRLYPDIARASVILFNRTGIRREHILDRVDRYFLSADSRS